MADFRLNNKILIIDDDLIFCNAMKYHLIQNEYDVDICVSYKEFQEKIDVKRYDLILLDMRLKDGEGLDILKDIADISRDKKVIIVSSYLDDEKVSKAEELGAYKCVHKNSQLFDVLDLIIDEI
ncbi:MAG: response regulator [bacterium]